MEQMNQNTEEWLKWRCNGIGASDAPAIMGKSLYKTKLQLWDEKFNKKIDEPENDFILQKGHKLEAWARPGIEFETGLTWRPALFTHQSFEFIRASLDGWNSDVMEVWECKYMGKDLWNILADESIKNPWERVPPQYKDQLMQQMFVSGAVAVRLTGVKEEKIDDVKTNKAYTLRIERGEYEQDYINKTLVPEIFKFWKSVQDGVRPEAEKQDVLPTENEELIGMVQTYGKLKNQEKELTEKAKKETEKILGDIPDQVKKLKSSIENHAARNHNKMDIEGFKLTEKKGKEIINYEDALNAFFGWIKQVKTLSPGEMVQSVQGFPEEPSLEKYTTAGKPSFAITIPKPKKDEEKVKTVTETKTETVKVGEVEKTTSTTTTTTVKPKEKLDEWKSLNPEQQTIVASSNAFKNPDTGKKPRGWDGKTREERIKYLRTHGKKASEPAQKAMFSLADQLENLDKQGQQETIGGITFEE